MINLERTESYKKILEHRKLCPKWGEDFCLGCFGNGLNRFVRSLEQEGVL